MWKNWGMILRLAVPSVVSFASATLSGTISLIMVGQLGPLAIAVVGVTNIVIYNAWAIFSGFGHSVNYLVAQNYGEGNMKRGMERTYVALYTCVFFAALVFAVGLWFSPEILRLIGGEGSKNLIDGSAYMELRFYALSFGLMNFVFHGFFRGVGDTVTPMMTSLFGNIVMIFFTYTLTYGHWGFPEWGLTGAGIAFLLGEAVGFLGCVIMFYGPYNRKFGTRRPTRLNPKESKLLLQESGKLGIQEFSLSASMLIFTVFVASLGEEALAANEIALSVMSLGFMPAFAFGSTATILVGQAIGRGNPFLARRYGTDTMIVGSMFLLVIGTVEFFFSGSIASIYTDNKQVAETAGFLIMISAFLQLFDGLLNFYAGGLRGIGDTSFLLRISFIMGFFVFVPLAYLNIYVFEWGSIGAWLALYAYLMVFGTSVMLRFYRTDWLKVRLKEAG
ncbi:MATE family efflux transporter [Xylanibacillus composti]|uniref:Probable multidrug resistance protein NorM n=1 Tax=Xylanibacillus composti TaxID=1572762 RepID=A0A8J4H6Q0_9BACL|nr:MATE family efflux transporter [Xylanibacillus composti]MDT9724734.1 MATE family efflux transporter [Xylanibacillus composti]GIQ70735.1 MATE family efflux transporter [Xylanibacillus composti]